MPAKSGGRSREFRIAPLTVAPQPETGLPTAPRPDFSPGADSFALELRAESLEQLCGGDALRRGETERIEAGGSVGNADLVAGCDRVQVEEKLTEHIGHGLAVQAAHLDTTVGGSFETWAGREDTVLLSGHMRDTWNGGTVTVAAMTDDTAAGGGVRATAPLDLWVHGLMGLEERPGTCTADGVLAEACGTLYEREYRSAVHAAGLAVFNGTLYQSVRNSFRPLMRISMGVRNLIAGDGGGAAGDAPPATPPPLSAAGGAGAQGTEAATDTLAAGRSAAETPPTGTGAVRLDDAAELTRESDIAAVSDDMSDLHRCADTAERLDGLRDALRGAEAGDEATSGSCVVRISNVDDAISGPRAGDAPGLLDGRSAAVALDPDMPALHAGSPQTPWIRIKPGLPGGAPGDPPRPMPDDFLWAGTYGQMNSQYRQHVGARNWSAADAYDEAIAAVEGRVMEVYVELGGNVGDLTRRPTGVSEAEEAYHAIRRMARKAGKQPASGGGSARYEAIEEMLEAVDRHTWEIADELAVRAGEFGRALEEKRRGVPLDPRVDTRKLGDWIEEQRHRAWSMQRSGELPQGYSEAWIDAWREEVYFEQVGQDLARGIDPRIRSHDWFREIATRHRPMRFPNETPFHARLANAMADATVYRPAETPGEVAGVATPPPVHAETRVIPRLGTESAVWPGSTETVRGAGAVAFDTGLQRVGEPREALARGSVDAASASGDAAVGRRHATDPAIALDPGFYSPVPAWGRDAFAVERTLIAGWLPEGFGASGLVTQWRPLTVDTPLEGLLESRRLPFPEIDSMIEGYRATEGADDQGAIIGQLLEMKHSIARALEDAYGYRADTGWLARVGAFLGPQAIGATPGFGRHRPGIREVPFPPPRQLVERLLTTEALPGPQASDLLRRFDRAARAGEIDWPAPRGWSLANLISDLRRISDAAHTSLAGAAGLEGIDWAAIDALLRLHDAGVRPA